MAQDDDAMVDRVPGEAPDGSAGREARAEGEGQARRRSRRVKFPDSTFEEALSLAAAIQRYASGQRVKRLTLFDQLGRPPEGKASRRLVTNSSKYGLTSGSYKSEYLELTAEGKTATSETAALPERARARFSLAMQRIPPFRLLYEKFSASKLPSQSVLRDVLVESGMEAADAVECVETFIANAKFIGLLRPLAGAERLLSVEDLIDDLESESRAETVAPPAEVGMATPEASAVPPGIEGPARGLEGWEEICFYITPIGEADSEARRHADLFFNSIVEPALTGFNLRLVRADQIGEPGMITRQVIEHVVNSRLVIADLSFHNPNVFYELSLRHACRRPIVQIIRATDRIPFDLDQFRTVKIDTSSIYTLVPQLETYKAQISSQVRQALRDPDAVDNPVSVFFPSLRVDLQNA